MITKIWGVYLKLIYLTPTGEFPKGDKDFYFSASSLMKKYIIVSKVTQGIVEVENMEYIVI